MRTVRFVGFLLVLILAFSVTLLVVTISNGKHLGHKKYDDELYKVNFKEIMKTDNSFIMFHTSR
jgi:hypothetical protein